MLNKKIFLPALAAFLLAGASVGLVSKADMHVAKADTHTFGIIGSFSDNDWASDKYDFEVNGDGNFEVTAYLPEGVEFKIRADDAWNWDIGYTAFSRNEGYDTWFSNSSGNAKVNAGYGGNYTFVLNGGIYDYGDKSYGVSITYATVTSYTVSEYAVVDGVKEATAFATEQAASGVTFSPTRVARAGFAFGGWFTDEACTSAYTATTLAADTNLYAKYTTGTYASLYIATSDWSEKYVYTYGQSEAMGSWHGSKVNDYADGVNFAGDGLMKVIYVKDAGDGYFIINDGNSQQTANYIITENAYYTLDAATDYAGDADKGTAAGLVYDIYEAIAATTNKSVCEISNSDASAFLTRYNALNASAKGTFDAATYYTWKGTETGATAEKEDITFSAIMSQISAKVSAGSRISLSTYVENNSSLIIIIATASVIAAAAVGFIVYKRKRA